MTDHWDILASAITWTSSYNKSPLISIYLPTYLSFGYAYLENSDTLYLELSYDPDLAIPLLVIYPKEMKAEDWTGISIPISSIIYNSQKLEETQVSIHRLMDKRIFVIYTYNGVVFSLKKEGALTHSAVWMNL